MKIKRLTETAIIPTWGSEGAAGLDLYADNQAIIAPSATEIIHTGIAIELEPNTFAAIYARSGLGIKRGLRLANSVGIIDADYRGELLVALHNDSNATQVIHAGDRIAQMVIQPYICPTLEETDKLNETARNDKGLGSTGVR